MNMEQWAMLAISVVVVPAVVWLVKEVLSLRRDLVILQSHAAEVDRNCHRHQSWAEGIQNTLTRLDRNIVRLCQSSKVGYEEP